MKLRSILREGRNVPNPAAWLRRAMAELSHKPYFSVRPQPKRLQELHLKDFNQAVVKLAGELLAPYGEIKVKSRSRFCVEEGEHGVTEQNGTSQVEFPWDGDAQPYLALDFWIEPDHTMDATTADMVVHEIMHGATEMRSGYLENLGGDRRGSNDDPEEVHNRGFSAANELLRDLNMDEVLHGLRNPRSLAGHSRLFDSYLNMPDTVRRNFLSNVYRFVKEIAGQR